VLGHPGCDRGHFFRIRRAQGIESRRFALLGSGVDAVEHDGVIVEMAI
jgi:hypothetical protein